YNLPSTQTKVNIKSKENNNASPDQVDIRGNLDEPFKKLDSASMNVELVMRAGIGALGGGAIGTAGTAIAVSLATSIGVMGTIGLSLLGGAVGTAAGAIIGYKHAEITLG
ncbi:MAG: hypothetical protein ABRQ39_22950, partial [Candidatus Eremiobacterota bacterium]